jgi:hypothetical protein
MLTSQDSEHAWTWAVATIAAVASLYPLTLKRACLLINRKSDDDLICRYRKALILFPWHGIEPDGKPQTTLLQCREFFYRDK